MRRCPIVDPEKDRRKAIGVLRAAARNENNGLLIFPEGHRSRDGQLLPFENGPRVILRERRMPVYLIASDGWFVAGSLKDLVLNMHRIAGRAEVLGPFEPPESDRELEAFVDSLRDRIAERLDSFRRSDASV